MPDVAEDPAPTNVPGRPGPIAPWLHTVVMLVVLGLWGWMGALRRELPGPATPRAIALTSNLLVELLLAGSAIAGLYARREFLAQVFARLTMRLAAIEVGLGVLVYVVGRELQKAIGLLVTQLDLSQPQAQVSGQAVEPFGRAALALWLVFCLTTAVCEEFLVRGYLLQQFTRWCGNAAVAVGATALLFGCMHLYEGAGAVIAITAMGVLYGIVVVRRGNLWAVIVAHFLQDALIGLFVYLRS
jgi:membrane protease YdiL (CAAX protease family)